MRHAEHRAFGDVRQLIENRLDLHRINVLAAGDEHLLAPADDAVKAVLVARRQIAGPEPAVAEALRGLLRPLVVAAADRRAAQRELAGFTGGYLRAVWV